MTDEELIARLRIEDHSELCQAAADRIEALVRECSIRDAATDEGKRLWAEAEARTDRLEAAMQKAIMLAEQPHYGDRDDAMDHCFDAIDVLRAALNGDAK